MTGNLVNKFEDSLVPNKLKDEMFEEIGRSEMMTNLRNLLRSLTIALTILAILILLFGVLGLILYTNKGHLMVIGVVSILHLIGGPIGWVGLRKDERNFFIVFAMINAFWLFSVITVSSFYMFTASSETRGEFNGELFLHVFLVIYVLISVAAAAICLLMLRFAANKGLEMYASLMAHMAAAKAVLKSAPK